MRGRTNLLAWDWTGLITIAVILAVMFYPVVDSVTDLGPTFSQWRRPSLSSKRYSVKSPKDLYPKLVRVGKEVYHIVFVPKLSYDDLGVCDCEAKLIMISLHQSREEMHATFWHEIMHAWEYELKVNLGHPRIRKLEWAIVNTLAQFPDTKAQDKEDQH